VGASRPRMPGMAETLLRTMFMSGAAATSAALARVDVVITPRTGDVGFLEWHQIDVLREAGRHAAAAALPAVLALGRGSNPAELRTELLRVPGVEQLGLACESS
jgi:predicted acylesterase/phospholipase RssA